MDWVVDHLRVVSRQLKSGRVLGMVVLLTLVSKLILDVQFGELDFLFGVREKLFQFSTINSSSVLVYYGSGVLNTSMIIAVICYIRFPGIVSIEVNLPGLLNSS